MFIVLRYDRDSDVGYTFADPGDRDLKFGGMVFTSRKALQKRFSEVLDALQEINPSTVLQGPQSIYDDPVYTFVGGPSEYSYMGPFIVVELDRVR